MSIKLEVFISVPISLPMASHGNNLSCLLACDSIIWKEKFAYAYRLHMNFNVNSIHDGMADSVLIFIHFPVATMTSASIRKIAAGT